VFFVIIVFMMDFVRKASLCAMGFVYFFAGLFHFIRFDYFVGLIPSFMSHPRMLVAAGGILQSVFAGLLIPKPTRRRACYAIILFWALSLPVSAYILYQGGAGIPLDPWVLKARIPFHLLLMAWAYWNSQDPTTSH